MKKSLFLLILCFLVSIFSYSKKQTPLLRSGHKDVISFNKNWTFYRYGLQADGTRKKEPTLNNLDFTNWQSIKIPHDFAIEGPFRMDIAGNTGRLPYKGIGWYHKNFPISTKDKNKQIYIDFDGVMANAKVWINGEYAGGWPYGYNSFRIDATPFLKYGEKNEIIVRTDTELWDSRWYPGAGIYRNTWLIKTGKIHLAHWGTFITTPSVTEKTARVHVDLFINNHTDVNHDVEIRSFIYELKENDHFGKLLTRIPTKTIRLISNHSQATTLGHTIRKFKRWDIKTPNRYLLQTQLWVNNKMTDCYNTPFGIRSIACKPNGFYLNNKRVAIKGTCNHHDLGALGAAINKSALQRQLLLLKNMGCNSLRTSHNPPAPELLELADKMGFLVMDEAFDAWENGKRKWDYNKLFKEWHIKDLKAMIFRDRNHPSVAFWSIGNEVLEQRNVKLTKHLVDIVKSMDTTRAVTNGYNDPDGGRASGACVSLDLMGVNYFFSQQSKWDKDSRYRNKPTIGTETSSCISSRGEYFFEGTKRKNYQITSYDTDHPGWGCTPDKQFAINAQYPNLLGEYVWTGFDYLGEPTPYNSDNTNLLNYRNDPTKRAELEKKLAELRRNQPPSRSSYFGIIDLAGFPKDRFYSYQAEWHPNLKMAHIFPHWNWPNRIGKKVPIHVYSSATEAELWVNGKSYGKKYKTKDKTFRFIWENVIYQPGTVKVITYKEGKPWAKDEICTTGKPYKLVTESNRSKIMLDGKEYAFITIKVVDLENNIVPTAKVPITINVSGPGELIATDNGDATDFTSFQSNQRKSFNGLALAIIRSTGKKGKITITTTSPKLEKALLTVKSVKRKKE